MVKQTQTCKSGHAYMTIRPTNYKGQAIYPPACPTCGKQ